MISNVILKPLLQTQRLPSGLAWLQDFDFHDQYAFNGAIKWRYSTDSEVTSGHPFQLRRATFWMRIQPQRKCTTAMVVALTVPGCVGGVRIKVNV